MRILVCVCAIAISIVVLTPMASARVIAGDLDNAVAVYYFSSWNPVSDSSDNRLHGHLFGGARSARISGRYCLSLDTDVADFRMRNNNNSLSILKEFSIVAWVKIPWQINLFNISIYAYNGSIDSPIGLINVRDVFDVTEGTVYLAVDAEGTLFGGYGYNNNEVGDEISISGRNVNNNQWQHIGFVITPHRLYLYINGARVGSKVASGHQSFSGTGTIVSIGYFARGQVDDVGFFSNDLSDTQVRMIYNQGLANIISIASADPTGKVATTWGALKQR